MNYILENHKLSLAFRSLGGELTSIKSKEDNLEYLWNGNSEYWSYHSPVLFPIVGRLRNNEYRINNNTYHLNQHGLARTSHFEMYKQRNNSIAFRLCYSEETLKYYPYKFALIITYTLIDNTIKIDYSIENLDSQRMYFSIGAHPAFLCPLFKEESLEDYYIEFNAQEDLSIMPLNPQGLFIKGSKAFLKNTDRIPLSLELFKDDALVFSKLKSTTATIKSDKHQRSISMNFSDFPYLGIWTKSSGAPFICLEPWHGHADYEDFCGDLSQKDGILALEADESFTCGYVLAIK